MSVNSFDMSWEAVNTAFESNGPKVNFMKLQAGDNRVRIGSMPSRIMQHWEKTVNGKSMKITCIGDNCPLCAMGKQPTIRYQMRVIDKIDRDDPQAKILEVGPSVIRQISNCVRDPEYGDPREYDLKIRKEGVGRETKYIVMASPQRYELTDHEKSMLETLPTMQEINRELTPEEIKKLPLECFNSDNSNYDDDFNTTNVTGKDTNAAVNDWTAIGQS